MIVEDNECAERGSNSKFVNSPQLKEVESLSTEKWEDCYQQTLVLIKDLYQKCKLVHADLSEYNLLLHNKAKVYVLDFGQALDTSHPEHKTYLLRDLDIVNNFFIKKGVCVQNAQEVLDDIVGESIRVPFENPTLVESVDEKCTLIDTISLDADTDTEAKC